MKDIDVIIIGGGLGGLTAGAKLSREGKKVLLIEQHTVPGGCATTFRRKGFTVEAGLHEMDGLDPEDPKMQLIEELDIMRNLEFVEIPEFYRFRKGSTDIVVPAKSADAIRVLVERYPAEEKGIRKFFRTIHGIRSETSKFMRLESWKQRLLMPVMPLFYPHISIATNKASAVLFPLFPLLNFNLLKGDYQTVGGFVDSIIRDEELKMVLLANFGYYHDDPYSLSLIYFSIAQASYYSGGGHFIMGGSQKLSDYLAGYISSHGGTVMLGNLVTRILIKEGKAVGVEYRKSRGDDSSTQTIFAETIVANAAIPNVEKMLPEKERAMLQAKTAGFRNSCCVMNLYLGFRREVSELKNSTYCTFVYNEDAKTLKDIAASVKGDIINRGFTFVDYSQIDSGLAPKGKSFGSLCTIDYLSDWDGLDREAYHQKKELVAQSFISKLEKLIPGISEEIEYYEIGTARTVERYTLNPGGAIYGYAQLPKQSGSLYRPMNTSPVRNLYFASAWTFPGGGFTGAMLSGWFCASDILRR
jgi:phytoene dehydrogenase-like protein